jgi:SAM-dependent methyltransferase
MEDRAVVRERLFAALALSLGLASLADGKTRADCEREYTPQRAQEGKDVIWAPTEDSMVGRMLEMANVTAGDKVYDLGSGDGKIPIAAAKLFGATAVGIEYAPGLVKHSRCLAEAEGVHARVTVIEGDIFATDFSDATVVTLYLTPAVNLRLQPTLLALPPGTRVVSYSFGIGDWEPDDHIDSFGDGSAFLYVVPANVHGSWIFETTTGEQGFEVELAQSFQKLEGFTRGASVAGSLRGNEVAFAFMQDGERIVVTGTVEGDRIVATVARGGTATEYVGARPSAEGLSGARTCARGRTC